jgi:hypothetical protein
MCSCSKKHLPLATTSAQSPAAAAVSCTQVLRAGLGQSGLQEQEGVLGDW